MSDATPDQTEPFEPPPPAAGTPRPTAAARLRSFGPWWRGRRVPLLITAAVLLFGCFLGGGVTAGAILLGDDHRGGDRISSDRDHGGAGGRDGRHGGRDADDQRPAPGTSTSSGPAGPQRPPRPRPAPAGM